MWKLTLPCDVGTRGANSPRSLCPRYMGLPSLSLGWGQCHSKACLSFATNQLMYKGLQTGGHRLGSTQGRVSSVLQCFQFLDIPCTNLDFLLLKSQKLRNPRPLPLWQQLAGADCGLPLGPRLSVPTVLQTLHCAPPDQPGPFRLPIRVPCWRCPSNRESGDLPRPWLAQAFSLLCGALSTAPAASH